MKKFIKGIVNLLAPIKPEIYCYLIFAVITSLGIIEVNAAVYAALFVYAIVRVLKVIGAVMMVMCVKNHYEELIERYNEKLEETEDEEERESICNLIETARKVHENFTKNEEV